MANSYETLRDTSILQSVRSGLGIASDDDAFDQDLFPHINAAITTIIQAGAGVPTFVMDDTTKWGDFIPIEVDPLTQSALSSIVQFVTLRTRTLFDPPSAGTMNVLTSITDEQLWRVHLAYDEENRRDITS